MTGNYIFWSLDNLEIDPMPKCQFNSPTYAITKDFKQTAVSINGLPWRLSSRLYMPS